MAKRIEFHDKRTWMKWLFVACPMETELETCPFKEYRNIPAEESFILADKMEMEKIEGIIAYHKTCISERESYLNS